EPVMQRLAARLGLSETAFFVQEDDSYHLRWFTPTVEVELCGHGTLASAIVIFRDLKHHIGDDRQPLKFRTKSGLLRAHCREGLVILDFPLRTISPTECSL